jgi:hypothetical protein
MGSYLRGTHQRLTYREQRTAKRMLEELLMWAKSLQNSPGQNSGHNEYLFVVPESAKCPASGARDK